MLLKPTTLSFLPFGLLLTDAFTCVNPLTVNTAAARAAPRRFGPHGLVATFVPPVDAAAAPSIVTMAAAHALGDARMGGLARLLDEMADPTSFWSGASPASSLFKRLDMTSPAAATAVASIKVDVKETDDAYTIVADMPGVRKEDIKLSWSNGNTLQISAERKEEREEKKKLPAGTATEEGVEGTQADKDEGQYYFKEVSYGKVYRAFRLPQNADSQRVEARLEDGVLRVVVPKKELPSEHTIPIH